MTLPVFIGNIAVNPAPLSPQPGPEPPPGALSFVVPSAPPQEEAEAVTGGPHFTDPISLFIKSYSQQPPLPAAFGSVPGSPELRPQDDSPHSHPLASALCISTGATVPFFAEGSGRPVPTASTSILPPEYSLQGHPSGEWEPRAWGGEAPRAPCRPRSLPVEAPPSYEQSCGSVDPGLTPGS